MLETTTGIMQRLRESTAELHQQAESQPLEQALVKGAITREDLAKFLGQRLLIHAALEAAIERLLGKDDRFTTLEIPSLLQIDNLAADVRFLGEDETEIAALPATTELVSKIERAEADHPVALLGAYYVFEGSKNGSRFIAKALRRTLGLERDGLRYFDPHGDEQPKLWGEFKTRMDKIDLSDDEMAGMVEAAKWTFESIIHVDAEIFQR